ncbi:hypothetical protein OH76DRAFT_1398025 [Lentinus brumalis]|uniref:Uncharacterized protein n=1 Tax=Lentinus brumalis TaxID=2498619 RepID=A0A371DQ44_9APHY|nr:hypothetical protein OH76DRAFT_1398025 [Polyporus brumalis]
MSYYREHVSFPNVAAGPYPPHVIAELERTAADTTASSSNDNASDDPNNRVCSVKGCNARLPAGYSNKMCEDCRGRHRMYAMTKRAKRKMEKALLNGSAAQNGQVVWMPQDDGEQEQPVAGPSRQYESHPQDPQVANEDVHFEFPSEWDPQAIDPRLFSQTSELAGALTLPGSALQPVPSRDIFARSDHQRQQPPPPSFHQQPPRRLHTSHTRSPSAAPPPPAAVPEIHPILAEVLKAVPNFSLSTRITSGPTVDSSESSEGPLPPRFCSIKGCKTLIAGNSFFKMCEPCRDRYRNYGTTKRAKWRREKEVAVQELHKLRSEEDARRAAEGLPPLPPAEDEQWQEYSPSADGAALPAGSPSASGTPAPAEAQDPNAPLPPRMCTVSHCREILPGEYQFLRCERHRIQNRHHSKLKRVRDKEVKAHVHDGWAAAVGTHLTGGSAGEDGTEDGSVPDVALSANDIAQVFGELEKELRDGSLGPEFTGVVAEAGVGATQAQQDGEDTPLGEPTSGVPPAARGTRRTNHVCSIKTCSNLLSPSNPWKMCDLCRSRDRASRRLKALRDSGLIPPEVAAGKIVEMKMEVEGRDVRGKGEKKEKKPKGGKKKKKAKKGEDPPTSAVGESATAATEAVESVASGSGSSSNAETEVAQQQHSEPTDNSTVNVNVDMSDGAIDPSALQHTPPVIESHTSIFSSLPNHANLIFMEPILGELASTIQRHLAQLNSGNSDAAPLEPQGIQQSDATEPTPPSQAAQTTVAPSTPPAPRSPARKASKAKGKAKATSQPDGNAEPVQEHSREASQSASTAAKGSHPPDAATAPAASGSTEDSSHHLPPPYPPPPNGYPYYMPPPYMPYGQPVNYQYGYPPPPGTPGKGPYPPHPPPMYQHPYGPYPSYPYPYPGQPYPYHGQPYMPAPPPPGQSYSPPPHQAYSPPTYPYPPPDTSPKQRAQPYPSQMQPYPYSHPYSPPQPPPQPVPQPTHSSPSEPEQPAAVYMTFSSRPKSPSVMSVTTQTAGRTSPPVTTITPTSMDQAAPASTIIPTFVEAPTTAAASGTDGPPDDIVHDTAKSPQRANGQPGQRRTTFIVRTSETYETPPNLQNKPTFALKRRRDEDYYDLVQNKRTEPDGCGYSMFKVSLSTTPTQSESVAPTPSPHIAQAHVPQPAVIAETSTSSKVQCGNKNCKRTVANVGSGSLCERCRERLKKKQAKAKHRFKLEPKTLLGRSSSDGSVPVVARA